MNLTVEPRIIFEDDQLLVLNKPAGMTVNRAETTVGEETLQDWVEKKILRDKDTKILSAKPQESSDILISQYPSDFEKRVGIVHRLDKETSGILLVAKTPDAFLNLQSQFKERKVKKLYTALVHGKVSPEDGEIVVPVGRLPWNRKKFGVIAGGKEAKTKYKVIRIFEIGNRKLDFDSSISGNQDLKKSSSKISHLSLLELYPETGRTHQIRVHLKYFNHPIFADFLYAGRKTARNDRKFLPRVFLHASKISFFHPKTSETVSFSSELPEELRRFLDGLEKVD